LPAKNEQKLNSLWAGKWTACEPTLWLLIFRVLEMSVILGFIKLPDRQWSDEMLAARIAQGDAAALEILYDRYAPMVLGIAFKIVGDRAAAENVLQETFWRVWKSPITHQPERGSFTGRLFRMARMLAMDACQQQSHHP
jgi:hypothetical protein